jgi:hypothetical protein
VPVAVENHGGHVGRTGAVLGGGDDWGGGYHRLLSANYSPMRNALSPFKQLKSSAIDEQVMRRFIDKEMYFRNPLVRLLKNINPSDD